MKRQAKLTIHVVQRLAPGGIETLALNMIRHAPDSEKVMIVSLSSTFNEAVKCWPLIEPFQSQLIFMDKPDGFCPSTLYQLVQLFLQLKPDVVHTHHIGPILYAGIAARLARIQHRIHTEHDAWHLASPHHQRLQKLALSVTKPLLVADADLVRKKIHHFIGEQKVSVIHNGIDCNAFLPGSKMLARRALDLPERAYIVGNAGRLEHVKGQDLLIDALLRLPNQVHLALAGSGSQYTNLSKQAESLGLAHRIHFLGHIDNMVQFYQTLDVFCLPSRNEGFPLATLEAQSCDIVTIASDVGAVKETLSPLCSYLVAKPDASLFAMAINQAMTSSHCLSPRSFVKKNNDIHQMISAYHKLTLPMEYSL